MMGFTLTNTDTTDLPKMIVAHNRDRDFYQVAEAFAEVGRLRWLVTDYYSRSNGRGLDARLGHRSSPRISAELTRCVPGAVALQALRKPLDRIGIDTSHQVNRLIGRQVRSLARNTPNTDLFLYSTYAAEAFSDPMLADRRKNLFMFHPHPTLIREILEPDVRASGIGTHGLTEETSVTQRITTLDTELENADQVFCASALTARSVIRAGVAKEKVHVVPYGIAKPMPPYRNRRGPGPVQFLFVGQAIHRKGVHHLLAAWRKARPERAKLHMVCSRFQDGLLDDLPEGVVVKSGLSKQDLWVEYCSAHAFILPALVEGFGLVLLEALSAGCHVIFSENTGFADLDIPSSAGSQIPAGDPEAIAMAMMRVAEMHGANALDHDAIHATSSLFAPEKFRSAIRDGAIY